MEGLFLSSCGRCWEFEDGISWLCRIMLCREDFEFKLGLVIPPGGSTGWEHFSNDFRRSATLGLCCGSIIFDPAGNFKSFLSRRSVSCLWEAALSGEGLVAACIDVAEADEDCRNDELFFRNDLDSGRLLGAVSFDVMNSLECLNTGMVDVEKGDRARSRVSIRLRQAREHNNALLHLHLFPSNNFRRSATRLGSYPGRWLLDEAVL